MAGVSRLLLVLALSGLTVCLHAQQVVAGAAVTAATTPAVAAPGSLQEALSKPAVLRGTLGDERVQLSVKPKADEDGLEGKYFVFGQSAQILLAGEVDQNDLMMEESHNGKDVSGQWEGSFKDGLLSGTWSTLDGSVTKPFSLKVGAP
ncbi:MULTISPECIES: hypothetical protein [unclassified Herbaspirillum]|uniref:hypothetical protein n=1 Tax=unclassified Herbaspirillum TaxID=2624150 RepID=UPI001F3B3280|nr:MULTISPECIES: hypothetical protein [unclassified Herbaspirillum]